MNRRRMGWISLLVLLATARVAMADDSRPTQVPALTVGLRHSVNQKRCDLAWSFPVMTGGDLGAPSGQGFSWMMIADDPSGDPASWKLPPGVVLGLKHSANQRDKGITVFGNDPVSGPQSIPGFEKQIGGDLGAPKGQGYFWYESTGVGMGDADWASVDNLPKGTIVGLKHSVNQRAKKLMWKNVTYDPVDASKQPPPGFKRMVGGDLGAPAHQGYYWYQKVTCPCSKAEGEGLIPTCDK
jgi:hypothetical protein